MIRRVGGPGMHGAGGLAVATLVGAPPAAVVEAEIEHFVLFNGTTSAINCGSDASLDDLPDAELTFEAWIRPDGFGEGGFGYVVERGALSAKGWHLNLHSANGLYARVRCAVTSAESTCGLDEFTADNQWQHIVMYFNDAGDRKIYLAVNGTWVASYPTQQAGVGAYTSDSGETLYFGNLSDGSRTFDGGIGWARISDNDRYNHENNFTPPDRTTFPVADGNTVELWYMNDGFGSGIAVAEVNTPANDGILVNTQDWGFYPYYDLIRSYNPIAYWQLTDTDTVGLVGDCSEDANQDGSYIAVALNAIPGPDGQPSGRWDGSNTTLDIYTATLAGAIDDEEGCIMIWAKAFNAALWADNLYHFLFTIRDNTGTRNWMQLSKGSNLELNQLRAGYNAGDVIKNMSHATTTLDWFHLALTWSIAADEVKMYFNGVEVDDDSSLGVPSLILDVNYANIGAFQNVPTFEWNGWLGHGVLFGAPLSDSEITALATIPSPAMAWSPALPTTSGDVLPEHWYRSDGPLWQDAGVTPAKADGDPVGRWEDKTRNDDHVNQAVVANKPTLQNAAGDSLNDKPVIRGDGIDDYLQGAFTTGGAMAQPHTMFAVAALDAAAVDNNASNVLIDGDGVASRAALLEREVGVTNKWAIYGGATLEPGATDSDSNWHIWTILFNGAASQVWQDGTSLGIGDAGALGVSGLTVFSNIVPDVPWDGDATEFILYGSNLSDADKNQIGQYLATRYGLTYTDI